MGSRNSALLVSVALVLAGSACSEQPLTHPSDSAVNVTGRVLAFADGTGVAGVEVVFGAVRAVTDQAGTYRVMVSASRHEPTVDGQYAGTSHVMAADYRGDFLTRSGNCVSRYGTVVDAGTARPVVGATVSLAGMTALTASDGWYRVDLGCPSNGLVGFNTTFIHISHQSYTDSSQVVGRGVGGVSRLDVLLHRGG
jgi:hypothetical protein